MRWTRHGCWPDTASPAFSSSTPRTARSPSSRAPNCCGTPFRTTSGTTPPSPASTTSGTPTSSAPGSPGKHVTDLLAEERMPLPVVDADATAMEIASVMAAARSPVVAVSGEADRTDAPMIGVITASHLLDRLLPAAPPDPA
ncbi:hypothetical protein LUX39_24560 [Actinomadura madurae]|nr:hypothetical protein [Actinomadura madurae]MCQ0016523.1 hypothetical protein [Actinomadura madurae]